MFWKSSQFATCSITCELFYQIQKFILNKNRHTENIVSVTQWKRWKQILFLILSLSRSIDRSINLIHISVKYLENTITCPGADLEIFQRGRLKGKIKKYI